MILKILLVIILIIIIAEKKIGKINLNFLSSIVLFFLFFISISFSVLPAENTEAFLTVYQNLVFSGVFLIISNTILDTFSRIKETIVVLLFSVTIGVFFEFLIYVAPELYQGVFVYVINPIITKDIDYNLARGRIYYESFCQALIPLFFYFLVYRKNLRWERFFIVASLILVIFNTIISNNRTFFLMMTFSLVGVIFLFGKFFIKKLFFGSIVFVIFFYILVNLTLTAVKQNVGFNIIDRILLVDEFKDKGSIISRIELWRLAAEIGFSYPIFGIGLGNFLEYVPTGIRINSFTQNTLLRKGLSPAYQNPHNIFFSFLSEAGILSASILFSMILYFFIKDIIFLIKARNYLLKSTIISFWSLFIFAFFNPTNSIRFYIFFWFFRILIEKLKYL